MSHRERSQLTLLHIAARIILEKVSPPIRILFREENGRTLGYLFLLLCGYSVNRLVSRSPPPQEFSSIPSGNYNHSEFNHHLKVKEIQRRTIKLVYFS